MNFMQIPRETTSGPKMDDVHVFEQAVAERVDMSSKFTSTDNKLIPVKDDIDDTALENHYSSITPYQDNDTPVTKKPP